MCVTDLFLPDLAAQLPRDARHQEGWRGHMPNVSQFSVSTQ
jgi:hypothetical protein